MINYKKALSYAKEIYSQFSDKLIYHNIHHANDVKKSVLMLCKNEKIPEHDLLLLKIAALYHDIGFLHAYNGHEEKSVEIVRSQFRNFGFSKEETDIVSGMIEATKLPQKPETHLEQLLCDADLDNFGRTDFLDNMDLLFQERLNFGFKTSRKTWYKKTYDMLRKHSYFTIPANKKRNKGKQKNTLLLKNILKQNDYFINFSD